MILVFINLHLLKLVLLNTFKNNLRLISINDIIYYVSSKYMFTICFLLLNFNLIT